MFRRSAYHSVQKIDPEKHFLDFLRSGMQTGADRGALRAARSLGLPICGWIPRNRLAREPIPADYDLFLKTMTEKDFPGLNDLTDLEAYQLRTEQNAKEGDGTLIFIQNEREFCGGTEYTQKMAIKHNKPWLLFNLTKEKSVISIADWIIHHHIRDLNVGGPNEEKSPGIDVATYDCVKELLLLAKLNQTYSRRFVMA